MEKYIKDGKVAILISPSYGSGWSTENSYPELAYDKRVVEFWLAHKDDVEYINRLCGYDESPARALARDYFKSIGYDYVYFRGFADIIIEWLPVGTKYVIQEYDGAEYICTEQEFNWDVA